jgi:hypothetical protein
LGRGNKNDIKFCGTPDQEHEIAREANKHFYFFVISRTTALIPK